MRIVFPESQFGQHRDCREVANRSPQS
ncbi:hypothetical protein M8C21_031706 [Ambrosia artemisiifolia]|uniref:Uncharacterized protein n=1 Tax=Ambrosia artemisiifolia TaxID=4212 RepID=A0AAD5CB65_AMBAR|nr:hypothetical protein M8C21_031706 [Ambrosia artemisiifolia]